MAAHTINQPPAETNMARQNGKRLRIVLLGDGVSGKSATGNTILGKRAFASGQSQDTITLTCQRENGEFEGTPLSVVDTPWTIRRNNTEMSKCISYCAPGPHAFLVVIPLENICHVNRHLKILHLFFGEEASRYTLVLFTHGDELPDGVNAEQFIRENQVPPGVEYHVFNNRDKDPSQVRKLLEKIKTMVENNGGSYCIKAKDWKHKYLYLFASVVTVGGRIGAASGGTEGGVVLAFVGSTVGAIAAHLGGNGTVAIATTVFVAAIVSFVFAIGAEIGDGAEVAAKAAAAIIAGAGTAGAAFKVFDDIDIHAEAFGVIGGATVGAGVSAAVAADAEFFGLAALLAVLIVLSAFVIVIVEVPISIAMVAGLATVTGVSIGAAFGAAAGVLGASRFAAGVIISIACELVTQLLNKKG